MHRVIYLKGEKHISLTLMYCQRLPNVSEKVRVVFGLVTK